MPETKTLLLAAGVVTATETLGITDFTNLDESGKGEKGDGPQIPGLPGSGIDIQLPALERGDIQPPDIDVPSGGGGVSLINPGGSGGFGGGTAKVFTSLLNRNRRLSNKLLNLGEGLGSDVGNVGSDITPNPTGGMFSGLAGAYGVAQDLAGDIDSFLKENPYVSSGAALGLSPLGPLGFAAGVTAGAVAEITADTVTGGTPLGVRSPIDVTGKGAWWKGPDPLGLSGFDPTNIEVPSKMEVAADIDEWGGTDDPNEARQRVLNRGTGVIDPNRAIVTSPEFVTRVDTPKQAMRKRKKKFERRNA